MAHGGGGRSSTIRVIKRIALQTSSVSGRKRSSFRRDGPRRGPATDRSRSGTRGKQRRRLYPSHSYDPRSDGPSTTGQAEAPRPSMPAAVTAGTVLPTTSSLLIRSATPEQAVANASVNTSSCLFIRAPAPTAPARTLQPVEEISAPESITAASGSTASPTPLSGIRWDTASLVFGENISGETDPQGMQAVIYASKQSVAESQSFWLVELDEAIFRGMGDTKNVLGTYSLPGTRVAARLNALCKEWPSCVIPERRKRRTSRGLTGGGDST